MTNTIPNVPRELLRDIETHLDNIAEFDPTYAPDTVPLNTSAELLIPLRALLSDPSPAGVDWPVRNFKTREGYDVWDKLCTIPKFGFLIGPSGGVVKVADIGNWIDRDEAQSVVDEAQCEVNLLRHEASNAQAIIDGLRGEVDKLMTTFVRVADHLHIDCEKAKSAPGKPSDVFIAAIDQQAQRIGELEGLLHAESARVDFLDAYIVTADATSTGKVAILADSGTLRECIDAALSAGKEGE